ncbi:hypothetical protein CLOM_g11494 [Closterium sp. NIES-68]|nr:hypothetical protein CLOM_g11494 [Closterium sp. NIES-68]GJP78510.1 hypothetical protein CLOP_g8801 [Closterium sp. NIES-67]
MAPPVAMPATLPATSCSTVAHSPRFPSARAPRTVSLGSFAGLKRVAPAALSPVQALLAVSAKHHAPHAAARRTTIRASGGAAAGGGGGAGAVEARKVLMMGGTRFIGVYLARLLVKAGHEVTLFTRGKSPVAQQLPGESDADFSEYSARVRHLAGDRRDLDALRAALQGADFDAVYDINGREALEVEPILAALPNLKQYIFCSSAGVYLKSDELPHREDDAVDPKSRHKGKLESEAVLAASGVAWTSIRPVYIYGPLNYNPVEEWFFHRLAAGRPIPVPGSGMQITQLGHVKDLARAFYLALGCEAACGQVLNVSGARYVTFDRIATACAEAMGAPRPLLVHYNPKDFDFGKSKAFPLRNQHFFAAIEKAERVLGWEAQYGLVDGLRDSYQLDFSRGVQRAAPNFTTDDMILEKLGVAATATT